MSQQKTSKANRLAFESSPYLLQHQFNPVDWYAWGDDAFTKAREEDKPVLLSVGYSACHWCHVMAHESFEDEETAALMNKFFINIKVDREERPDIDAIYMSAVQAMTGAGGWPMTVVMTPDGAPFFGGTYFPPDDRFGRLSFKRVLTSLASAWQDRRDDVLESATSMTDYLQKYVRIRGDANARLNQSIINDALDNLHAQFDPQHGGFGGAPKFPPHSSLQFLQQHPHDQRAQTMLDTTLSNMMNGGMYDQLAGGFARYSVDDIWLVPHFEKMLYDNAQLVQTYTRAYQQTSNPDLKQRYAQTVHDTLEWLVRDMQDASGGFYSAIDADSEGEEGKFYVWTAAEFDTVLGEDAALAKALFGVQENGNFEGKSILHRFTPETQVCNAFGLNEASLKTNLRSIKTRLLAARNQRVKPGVDDKILTSWNGLALSAFADAARVFNREDYLRIAKQIANFLRTQMLKDGRLLHSYKNGHASIHGLLEDYAYSGLGFLALYRATLNADDFMTALELANVIVTHFKDEEAGGFFSTADDAEALIVRPKNYFDAATPSENAATAQLLLTLSRFTDNPAFEELAVAALSPFADAMREQARGFSMSLCVAQQLLTPSVEIAIVGDKNAADTRALLAVAQAHAPFHAVMALVATSDDALVSHMPFLQQRSTLKGRATAYVCERGTCQLPVTEPDALKTQIEAIHHA